MLYMYLAKIKNNTRKKKRESSVSLLVTNPE